MALKELSNITIVCVDCKNYGAAISALKKSIEEITPAKAILVTDRNIPAEGIEIKIIPPIKSKYEYSHFIVKELDNYFDTDYVLVVQYDGYILNGDCWRDEFYNFDFIGAAWLYVDGRNVGNGGFSLRSKKLQHILATDEFITTVHHEDDSICRLYRPYLEEKYGIKFAPDDVADKFSFELRQPICRTFGFHGNFWKPFKETVVIKREAALGDVIRLEPLLHYFFKNGYKVVLDTLPQFYAYFAHHYFEIQAKQDMDGRIPYTEYNLDMSYESNPKQLHLKTYYDFCGIDDGEIRNPKLNYVVNKETRLFNKYVCLHIEKRPQPYRNIMGVNWQSIVTSLKAKGCEVIQLGVSIQPYVGAIQMKTIASDLLAYVIAGCDLFIGVDSGLAHLACATQRKMIVYFGSVDPNIIYADLTNITVMQKEDVCDTPKCWHNIIGCEGKDCYVDKDKPPCVQFDTMELIEKINELI